MTRNTQVSISTELPNAPIRDSLQPGDVFVYAHRRNDLRLVPNVSFSSMGQHLVGKDVILSGEHAGMTDDSTPSAQVIAMDIVASPSSTAVPA
jgi:hypothetical protein